MYFIKHLVIHTVIASASCLAKGVDHEWPVSDELHLAPENRHCVALNGNEFRENCLAVRDRLLLIISRRVENE